MRQQTVRPTNSGLPGRLCLFRDVRRERLPARAGELADWIFFLVSTLIIESAAACLAR